MLTTARRQREKQDRAQTILDAAETVLAAHGLAGLSMDLVAQEAQLAKGTLYLYFASKDDLLAALTLKARRLLLESFQAAVNQTSMPLDQLKTIIRSNLHFQQQHPIYYELISLSEINNKSNESAELQEASLNITRFTVGIIAQAQALGQINSNSVPANIAVSMWGMTVGMMRLIKARGASLQQQLGLSETDVLDNFIDLLMNGMNAR